MSTRHFASRQCFRFFFFSSFVFVHVKRHREKERLPGKLVSRERMGRPVTLESKFENALFPLKKVFEKEEGSARIDISA